jgi:integrase
MWLTRTPHGWRYFPVLYERVHGVNQPRQGWVNERGEEVEYKQGRYVLRSYVEGNKVYKPIPECHPRDAMYALQREERAAKAAGAARDPLLVIRTAKEGYVRDLTQQKKSEMAQKANHVLGEFQTFCENHKFKTLHMRSITRQHILDFHAQLRKKGNSERTIHDKHQRVKAWLRFCKVDTSFMPPAPKFEQTLPTVYEKTQIDDIRAAADDEMRLAIDLCWMLGLREREATHAEWDDIDWQHSVFRVQGKVRDGYKFRVKDKEQREVPIPGTLLERLKAWKEAHPKTRLIISGTLGLPEGHLLRKLKALARNNNLNCTRCEGCQRRGAAAECQEWSLHRFRRTFCTTLLQSGVDLATVQQLAGHSDLASTMRYLRPAATTHVQDKMNAIFGGQQLKSPKKRRKS